MVTETTDNNSYAGKGSAYTGLALGATALGLYALNGGLSGILGNRPPVPPPEPMATQRDLGYERQLTAKDAEIGQLKAQQYADAVVLAAERRLADKIEKIETGLNGAVLKQAEYNVANTAAVASIGQQTAQLMKMTGLIINGPAMAASEAAASVFKAAA